MSQQDKEKLLVEGIIQGQETSYRELVETYWHEFHYSALRILKNYDDANDCVQNAFIKAINNIKSYRAKGSFKGWLHRIVSNEALMELRKQKRRKEEGLDEFMLDFDEYGGYQQHYSGEPVTLEALIESKEVRALVKESIDRLPDNYRITLLMRDIEGYSIKETAELMGTTEENVKVRLHRARLALRSLLKPVLREESR